jgi:hypothetical protein
MYVFLPLLNMCITHHFAYQNIAFEIFMSSIMCIIWDAASSPVADAQVLSACQVATAC